MVILIMWGYWWITWSAAIIFLFIFPSYYEIIVWGVMYDALYGLPIAQFAGFRYVFTAASVILFTTAFFLRKLLLTYEDRF
jgi:hypothetical protein